MARSCPFFPDPVAMPSPRLPLVLLPGLLNDARLWQHQIAGLADIAQPHVGDVAGADRLPVIASSVLRSVPAPRFALVGFSMGGYVALEIMRQSPERVSALVLVDTSARPDTPQATARRHEQLALAERDFDGVVEALRWQIVHPDLADDPVLAETFRAMARRVGPAGFVRQQQAIIARPDSRPDLRDIACPTTVICGRDDPVTPVEVHEELRDGIAGAQLVVIGTCGHLSPLERAPEVTGALRAFLDRVPRQA
jgi:pimeloyl-ACP methyl ester carboxylesterase